MLKLLFLLAVSAYEYYSTPTFGSITATAASPNSATVSVTVTGGVSMQVQASTDTSYSIHSPWFDVAASTIIGQLQPGTLYNVRVVACDASMPAHPASAACSGNAGTSGTATVTTSAAITSWTIGFSIGSTVSYNGTQYPLNGRWMHADTTYCAQATSLTISCQHNDGSGPQAAQGDPATGGGRNVYMTTVDAAFTTFTLLNSLGNGSTTGVGHNNNANFPACWSDGSTIKSGDMLADGNTLYWWAYRQLGSGYNQRYPYISKSIDGGASWAVLGGSATTASSPPCPGDPGIMWSTAALALPRWVKPGGAGNAITNPVHGIDAYWYALVRNNANTSHYLARCFKPLNMRDQANWEYYGGTVGGDVDLPAGWSTDSTALTSVYDSGGSTPVFYGNESPQYLADFGRFVMPSEVYLTSSLTDGSIRLALWDSANMTSWTRRYSEPTKPPFNSTNGVYLNRAWNSIWMPTYTSLGTIPPSATIQILSNGTEDQQHFADPPNDMYSPFMATGTLSAVPMANHIIIADKSSRKRDGAQ